MTFQSQPIHGTRATSVVPRLGVEDIGQGRSHEQDEKRDPVAIHPTSILLDRSVACYLGRDALTLV